MENKANETELDGYNITKTDIESLPNGSNIKIRFTVGSMPGWGSKDFRSPPYFNSQIEQLIKKISINQEIKYQEHDCGDPNCPGIGETYILKSDKLKTIAKTLT